MRFILSSSLMFCVGCSASVVPIQVPQFAVSDSGVDTAGFVGETLRLSEDVGDAKYTLMAFRVGDVVSLGAMVKGTFDGRVEWRIGASSVTLPFSDVATADSPDGEWVAEVSNGPAGAPRLIGERAAFRGSTWIIIELEPALWLPGDSTPVSLTFRPDVGEPVFLPDDGVVYDVGFVQR